MRFTRSFIPTLKEIPADAAIPSHQLMIRAGLVRQLAAGIYTELPLGWRSVMKAIEIVRQEMNRIGGQELFMPVLNPIEVWEETGRAKDFGDELFRLKDRRGRFMCLAPTHEEIICDLARSFIRSYRDLPQIWYQFQTKLRDEPRPRSGVLRARQFIMKDSYSLDVDEEGLDRSYHLHAEAYRRIFERCGLKFFVVGASSGLMGGSGSQEFMVESPHGEDSVTLCDHCGYAANLEVANSSPPPILDPAPTETLGEPKLVPTPEKRTIAEVSEFLGVAPERLIKTLVMMLDGEKPLMVLLAGDDELHESKLTAHLKVPFRPAHPEEIRQIFDCETGFLGPVKAPQMLIIADHRLKNGRGRITGANRDHHHITGVEVGRHFHPDCFADLRMVKEGEACTVCQSTLRVVNAIEIGHIFKLGTKYSAAMGAHILDADGREKPIFMGSYGIGIGRILACAIELGHDDQGIIWPPSLAPFDVILIGLNMKDTGVSQACETLYQELQTAGFEVIFDDRDERSGFKFNDADLLGIPLQVIISPKTLREECAEVKLRSSNQRSLVKLNELLTFLRGQGE
ncbi:MAG: proline--tRNA ligase [bacterium]